MPISFTPTDNEAAKVWLDKILLPVTPEVITIHNEDKNEIITLADGQPATIQKLDGAQVFSFEILIPNNPDTFVFNDHLEGIRTYTDWVWNKKWNKEPVVLTITRPNGVSTNEKVTLSTYSYDEDAKIAGDYKMKLEFKQYHPWGNHELNVDANRVLEIKKGVRNWRNV